MSLCAATCVVCSYPASVWCGRCREERYCGRDCQRLAWRAGHRQSCRGVLTTTTAIATVFRQLPRDVVLRILLFLAPGELCMLGRTCQDMHSLYGDNQLWRPLLERLRLGKLMEPAVSTNAVEEDEPSSAKQAYMRQLADAQRTHLTSAELCRPLPWLFRFKAGKGLDHMGLQDTYCVFELYGSCLRYSSVTPDGNVSGEPLHAPIPWRFRSSPAQWSLPGDRPHGCDASKARI
jgi:hypothetical protein